MENSSGPKPKANEQVMFLATKENEEYLRGFVSRSLTGEKSDAGLVPGPYGIAKVDAIGGQFGALMVDTAISLTDASAGALQTIAWLLFQNVSPAPSARSQPLTARTPPPSLQLTSGGTAWGLAIRHRSAIFQAVVGRT